MTVQPPKGARDCWGGVIVNFAPSVTPERAREFLAALAGRIRDQEEIPVLDAMFQGPALDAERAL